MYLSKHLSKKPERGDSGAFFFRHTTDNRQIIRQMSVIVSTYLIGGYILFNTICRICRKNLSIIEINGETPYPPGFFDR